MNHFHRWLRATRVCAARCAAFSLLHLVAATPAGAADAVAAWAAMPTPLLPTRLPVPDAPGWTLRAEAANFEVADATPVRALSDDWARYHPRGGRNAALQSARIELVAAHARWEVAAALRSDILIEGSRGAFDLVHAYKQRQTPADGSAFAVDAQEQGVVSAGLRGARTWVLRPGSDNGLQATAALTLLSVRRVQVTDVRGEVQYSTAAGYAFDAHTLQQDSRKPFGGFGTSGTTGNGYTLDAGLLWQASPDTFVNLSAGDVLSRLRIRNVAMQQTTLSSSTSSLDGNGFLAYKPLVNGRNSASDVSLRLTRKWSASVGTRIGAHIGLPAGHALDDALVGARWERIGNIDLPALWAVLPLWPGMAAQMDAETRFRSFGIGLTTRHGSLLLRSSSLPVGTSRALGWQASFMLPW